MQITTISTAQTFRLAYRDRGEEIVIAASRGLNMFDVIDSSTSVVIDRIQHSGGTIYHVDCIVSQVVDAQTKRRHAIVRGFFDRADGVFHVNHVDFARRN